jgi:hypothetical protein
MYRYQKQKIIKNRIDTGTVQLAKFVEPSPSKSEGLRQKTEYQRIRRLNKKNAMSKMAKPEYLGVHLDVIEVCFEGFGRKVDGYYRIVLRGIVQR